MIPRLGPEYSSMIGRAVAIWLGILLLANLNGAIRELWLILTLGETAGRALSTLMLSALVLVVTWLAIGWIRPATPRRDSRPNLATGTRDGPVRAALDCSNPKTLVSTRHLLSNNEEGAERWSPSREVLRRCA
jgi:hypothetical protein